MSTLLAEIFIGAQVFVSIAVGIIFDRLILQKKPNLAGRLLIDSSDPETELYRLCIDIPLEELPEQDTILIKVISDVDLSQKEQSV